MIQSYFTVNGFFHDQHKVFQKSGFYCCTNEKLIEDFADNSFKTFPPDKKHLITAGLNRAETS